MAHILLGEIPKIPESRHCGQYIEIFVKYLTGRTKTHCIDRCASILELKEQILDREGIPLDAMRLIYGGRPLEDHRCLDEYNIQKESTIHLLLRGVGRAPRTEDA